MSSTVNRRKRKKSIIKRLFYNIIPFDRRYGYPVYANTLKFLLESRDWSRERLEAYRNDQFLLLVEHCYNNVPYYRNVMNERGINSKSFRTIEDISLLPILTKRIIKDNHEDLIAQNLKHNKSYTFKTSGSTGEPFAFLGTNDVYKKEAAFVHRAYIEHGGRLYDEPSVWIKRYVPATEQDGLWYYDYELKRLYMSAYHINQDTIKSYVDEINRKKYHTLVGYPSSLFIFSSLCSEMGLELKHIKAIHGSSEMMLPSWEENIEHTFGIKPRCHYGAVEKISFMHQRNHSNDYYNNYEYGVTEYVGLGKEKTIVGTGFLNYYMPFLRYQTNDVVILNNEITTEGLPNQVNTICGRSDDILIGLDGTQIPSVDFYSMMYRIDGVRLFQLKQKRRDLLECLIVIDRHADEESLIRNIHRELKKRLGSMAIEIKLVDEISRNKNTGKIRCIINEIK